MARSYYQCSSCFELEISNGTPRTHGCSPGWKRIADEGNKNIYVCKKGCGIRAIGVNSTPQAVPCPQGGNHTWKKVR